MMRVRILVLLCLVALLGRAQLFNFSFGGGEPVAVEGTVRLEPAHTVVGVTSCFVFSFKSKQKVQIQQIQGLPDHGVEYLAETLEPYADNTYRLPVRFTEPNSSTITLSVSGMATTEKKIMGGVSSFSSSFSKRLPPLKLDVRTMPTDGRPQNFSGAVGTKFQLTQKLEPDRVHPGDLVTATYELSFDGYCPSNIWPNIEHLSKEFKAYEPKEVARTGNSIKWTQMLVPRTTAATNSALVSVSYYNSEIRRYEIARAVPRKLVFVSAEAASTKNTSVVVNETPADEQKQAPAGSRPIELRFAPAEQSPVVAILPAGTPVKELACANGWRRLESAVGIGWAR